MNTIKRSATALAGVGLAAAGVIVSAGPADAASCYASRGHLYCGNSYKAPIMKSAAFEYKPGLPVPRVDRLHTTFSYFKCRVYGARHSGGNSIWYYTNGDEKGKWGYVAASYVFTPKDPFPGVKRC